LFVHHHSDCTHCIDPDISGKKVSMLFLQSYEFIGWKHWKRNKESLTILEWIPAMVDTVPLIIWLVFIALMRNFCCCQKIQQRQSYKLRVHGVNPQSPLKV
jgi:hypothetical protein